MVIDLLPPPPPPRFLPRLRNRGRVLVLEGYRDIQGMLLRIDQLLWRGLLLGTLDVEGWIRLDFPLLMQAVIVL